MPVLAIGGEKALGEVLGQQMKLVASDVTVVVLKTPAIGSSRKTPGDTDALVKFL